MDKTDGKKEILEYFKEVPELDGVLEGIRKDWGVHHMIWNTSP